MAEAADIFVTPYPNIDQIVSGTLSYAMGSGKAIVSTPYAYALERLADGRGRLVAPASSQALADGFIDLLGDRERGRRSDARAYAYSRGMIWPRSGRRIERIFARGLPVEPPPKPLAKLDGRGGCATRSIRSIAAIWTP